jgi:YHS domain-containing protein
MTVTVEEYVKIVDDKGQNHVGIAIATNLVAIKSGEDIIYGAAVEMDHIHTTIVCDNPQCENSTVDDNFQTHPKRIEFDENKENSADFIKDLAEVTITTDYKGVKSVFCSPRCAAHFLKKPANVLEFSSGKGTRTFDGLQDSK